LNVELVEGWYNQASFYDNVGDRTNGNTKQVQAVASQPASLLRDKWIDLLNGKSIRFPCFAMHTFCVLKANGDIVPCINFWDRTAGNVKDASPTAIWHSAGAKEVRKAIDGCEGCLNSWGFGWSIRSSYYPILQWYLKNPKAALGRLRGKIG
jgi:MoaA/NifB/PqqE/SkfB family radical SAM enzyme